MPEHEIKSAGIKNAFDVLELTWAVRASRSDSVVLKSGCVCHNGPQAQANGFFHTH